MAPLLHFTGIAEKIFFPVPSLECIASVKVAIALWNLLDVRQMLNNHRFVVRCQLLHESQKNNREIIETKVRDCAKKLWLSKTLENEVEKTIINVGREIWQWKKYHEIKFEPSQDFDVLLPDQLFWTAFGTIDRKKTAQAVVKDSSLCVALRYKFACTYCLERDITELWKELDSYYRSVFQNNRKDWGSLFSELVTYSCSNSLEYFWSYVMGGGGNMERVLASEHFHLISEFLVRQMSEGKNIAALPYFFTKFTQEMRDLFLEKIIDGYKEPYSCLYFRKEVFLPMLSYLNESQQKAMLADAWCHWQILSSFFHWPWDNLFMPVARCLYPFLTPSDFVSVLELGVSRNDTQELFTEFFNCSSEHFKQYTVDICSNGLLLDAIEYGHTRLIQMIWKLAAVAKRAAIINAYEKIAHLSNHERYRKHWGNLFVLLIELSREERKRDCFIKKIKREGTKEERNAKKFKNI